MTLTTLRFSRAFRFANLLALWALLLPALLPLVHPMAAMSGGQPCHMMAMAGDHQAPVPHSEKSSSSCPICQSLASLSHGYVPPDVVALFDVIPTSVTIVFIKPTSLVFNPTPAAWPRAPPILA